MDSPVKKRRLPRHLWWGVGIPLVLVVIGAFRVPDLHRKWMSWNEREVITALNSLAVAEADFRANDRDGNRVQDYWTADVAGLWHAGRLIEHEVADADAAPLDALVREPVPYNGYYFIALRRDLSAKGHEAVFADYRADTDGSGRKVHSQRRFGYCAYPAEYGWTGRHTFIVNEYNRVLKFDRSGKPFTDWPSERDLGAEWAAEWRRLH